MSMSCWWNVPLAASGTVVRSLAKLRSSGKCWHSDLARMWRNVDFPSTVFVVLSLKGQKRTNLKFRKGPIIRMKHDYMKPSEELNTYLSEKVDFKSSCPSWFRLTIVQIIPHRQHKLWAETICCEMTWHECCKPGLATGQKLLGQLWELTMLYVILLTVGTVV